MGTVIQRGEMPSWIGSGSGSGDGDGDGSGSGSGSGYGYGDGYGDGYGYGYGYGDGSGSGYGYGYGSGDGSGSGSGDGDGDGYGYGDGYGSPEYWRACISHFAVKWPQSRRVRLAELQITGATIAYWRSNSEGRACNGGHNAPVAPGSVETVTGPLEVCTKRALHATLLPPKWEGERWWIVALLGEVQGDETKYGALTREILGEAL